MINAAIVGIGWWGQKIVGAVLAGRAPYPVSGEEMIATIAAFEAVVAAMGAKR